MLVVCQNNYQKYQVTHVTVKTDIQSTKRCLKVRTHPSLALCFLSIAAFTTILSWHLLIKGIRITLHTGKKTVHIYSQSPCAVNL